MGEPPKPKSVQQVLDEIESGGYPKEYSYLCQIIQSADVVDIPKQVLEVVTDLSNNVSRLDSRFTDLVKAVMHLPWALLAAAPGGQAAVAAWEALLQNIVSAHPLYTGAVLKVLVDGFARPEISCLGASDSDSGQVQRTDLELIQHITALVRTAEPELMKAVNKGFPYVTRSTDVQRAYVTNIFKVAKILPNLRGEILRLVIDKMLTIDAHSPRQEIVSSLAAEEESLVEAADAQGRTDGGGDALVFDMESVEAGVPTGAEKYIMSHPMADKLDALMDTTLDWMRSECHVDCKFDLDLAASTSEGGCKGRSKDRLDWNATKRMYVDVMRAFDDTIVRTHGSGHVQFLLFYLLSLRPSLHLWFLDACWRRACDPRCEPMVRHHYVAYAASLVARAAYIPVGVAKDNLFVWSRWCRDYASEHSADSEAAAAAAVSTGVSASQQQQRHGTFYALCQAVFYVIAFRHRELVLDAAFLHSLCLDRVVTSRLNPLRTCHEHVVQNFASVMRQSQVVYCDTVIEHNRRTILRHTDEAESGLIFDFFFPFDPYLLRRSARFFRHIYREYSHEDSHDTRHRRPLQDRDRTKAERVHQDSGEEDTDSSGSGGEGASEDEGGMAVDLIESMYGISKSKHLAVSPGNPADLMMFGISPGFKHS